MKKLILIHNKIIKFKSTSINLFVNSTQIYKKYKYSTKSYLNICNSSKYKFFYNFEKRFSTSLSFNQNSLKIEETLCSNTIKIYIGKEIIKDDKTYEYLNKIQALESPLASRLFYINGINRVFYGKDHICIEKEKLFEWEDLKCHIIKEVNNFYSNHLDCELFTNLDVEADIKSEDNEKIAIIKKVIAGIIRPTVKDEDFFASVNFHSYDEVKGKVYYQLEGNPIWIIMFIDSFNNFFIERLRKFIPEVQSVEEKYDKI